MKARDAIIHDDYRWVEISPWDNSLSEFRKPRTNGKDANEDQRSDHSLLENGKSQRDSL